MVDAADVPAAPTAPIWPTGADYPIVRSPVSFAATGQPMVLVSMQRRDFIKLLAGAAAAWPLAARAQQERMRRIGILMAYPKGDPELTMRLQAFRQELAKLGWTQGVNVQLDRALDRGRYGSRALRGGKSGEVKSGRVLL